MRKIFGFFGICLMGLTLIGHSNADVIAIMNDFDSTTGGDIGPAFQVFTNGSGGNGTGNTGTGLLDNTGGNTNATGFNTVTTTDLTSLSVGTVDSFEVEIVIDSVAGGNAIQSNGFFLGIVSGAAANGTGGAALFNNDPEAFGLQIFQGSTNTNFNIVEDGSNPGGATNLTAFTGPSSPNGPVTSVANGFSVDLVVNSDDTFSVSTTGFQGGDLSGSGTLSLGSFSEFATDLGVSISAQGPNVDVVVDSVTVTAIHAEPVPEPSSMALLGLAGLALLRRRKRS